MSAHLRQAVINGGAATKERPQCTDAASCSGDPQCRHHASTSSRATKHAQCGDQGDSCGQQVAPEGGWGALGDVVHGAAIAAGLGIASRERGRAPTLSLPVAATPHAQLVAMLRAHTRGDHHPHAHPHQACATECEAACSAGGAGAHRCTCACPLALVVRVAAGPRRCGQYCRQYQRVHVHQQRACGRHCRRDGCDATGCVGAAVASREFDASWLVGIRLHTTPESTPLRQCERGAPQSPHPCVCHGGGDGGGRGHRVPEAGAHLQAVVRAWTRRRDFRAAFYAQRNQSLHGPVCVTVVFDASQLPASGGVRWCERHHHGQRTGAEGGMQAQSAHEPGGRRAPAAVVSVTIDDRVATCRCCWAATLRHSPAPLPSEAGGLRGGCGATRFAPQRGWLSAVCVGQVADWPPGVAARVRRGQCGVARVVFLRSQRQTGSGTPALQQLPGATAPDAAVPAAIHLEGVSGVAASDTAATAVRSPSGTLVGVPSASRPTQSAGRVGGTEQQQQPQSGTTGGGAGRSRIVDAHAADQGVAGVGACAPVGRPLSAMAPVAITSALQWAATGLQVGTLGRNRGVWLSLTPFPFHTACRPTLVSPLQGERSSMEDEHVMVPDLLEWLANVPPLLARSVTQAAGHTAGYRGFGQAPKSNVRGPELFVSRQAGAPAEAGAAAGSTPSHMSRLRAVVDDMQV